MPILTRRLLALLKFASLWSLPWTLLGAALGLVRWLALGAGAGTGTSLVGWVGLHALGYGMLGLISGLNVGLLLARGERGRSVEQLSRRRVALWSVIGGAGPAVLFAGLAAVFKAPASVYLPLVFLGTASAAISGALALAALHSRRGELPRREDRALARPEP